MLSNKQSPLAETTHNRTTSLPSYLNNQNACYPENYTVWTEQLIKQILERKSYEDILQTIAVAIQNPVALFTRKFSLISLSSSPFSSDCALWQHICLKRKYPNSCCPNVSTQKFVERSCTQLFYPNQHKEYFFPTNLAGTPNIPSCILYVFASNKPLDNTAVEFVQFASTLLSSYRERALFFFNPEDTNPTFSLADILTLSLSSETAIQSRFEDLNITLGNYNWLIVIEVSADTLECISLLQIRQDFESIWPNSVFFGYHNSFIVLVPSLAKFSPYDPKLILLNKLLMRYQLYAGISDSFTSLTEFRNHYFKALNISQNRPANTVNYMTQEDFLLRSLVRAVAKTFNNPQEVKTLCDPYLYELFQYDQLHGTEYVHTLKCFLKANRSNQKTSANLFLHTNTITYRIKKIKSFLKNDFQNPDYINLLILSLAIIDYLTNET